MRLLDSSWIRKQTIRIVISLCWHSTTAGPECDGLKPAWSWCQKIMIIGPMIVLCAPTWTCRVLVILVSTDMKSKSHLLCFLPSSGGSRRRPAGRTCAPASSCSGPWRPPGPRWGWSPGAAAPCLLRGPRTQSPSAVPGRGRSGCSARIALGGTPPSSEPRGNRGGGKMLLHLFTVTSKWVNFDSICIVDLRITIPNYKSLHASYILKQNQFFITMFQNAFITCGCVIYCSWTFKQATHHHHILIQTLLDSDWSMQTHDFPSFLNWTSPASNQWQEQTDASCVQKLVELSFWTPSLAAKKAFKKMSCKWVKTHFSFCTFSSWRSRQAAIHRGSSPKQLQWMCLLMITWQIMRERAHIYGYKRL